MGVRVTIGKIVLLGLISATAAFAEDDGRAIYETKGCYQCHGYVGQGGGAGPKLAPQPIPYQAFALIVRKPPDVMPAYSRNVLTDAELEAIYQYLTAIE